MKFEYKNFSCDAEIFKKDFDILVRFYDKSNEQNDKILLSSRFASTFDHKKGINVYRR